MSAFKSAAILAVLGLMLAGGAGTLLSQTAMAAAPSPTAVAANDGGSSQPQPSTDDDSSIQIASALR